MDIEAIGELDMDMTSSAASSVVMTDSTIIFKNDNLRLGKDGIYPISENVSTYSPFHIEPKQIQQCELIGRGASSTVYRTLLNREGHIIEAAMKIINVFEKDKREQILNDLKTFFSGCSCPNMVSFYGCFYEQGRINQVIEFMDMGSLRGLINLIHTKKLKIPQVILANIARQITIGLQYVHCSKNLIHRDIKPENVLLNSRGEVKIADFGVSKHLDKTHGLANTFVGTLIYMSPERITNKKYGHNCDVWSFGLVMYELATGDNPYKFEKGNAALTKVVQVIQMQAPRLDQTFSPEFRYFISVCLTKDPQQRYSTSQLASHPWLLKYGKGDEMIQWIHQLKVNKWL